MQFSLGSILWMWRDSNILSSLVLLHVPVTSKWSRHIWGPPQSRRCSRIWDWGGGVTVKGAIQYLRTLTPACSAARVAWLLTVEPTYCTTVHSANCPPFINIDFDFVLFLADDANRIIFGEFFNKCASSEMFASLLALLFLFSWYFCSKN